MFDNVTTADDRGQVGIETLIVFIAMILVAAIAAGILIDVASNMRGNAKATSEDSTERVSNQVVAISAVGGVDATGSNVTSLNLTVMLSPGADEIDLSGATVEWIGPTGHDTLVYSNASVSAATAGTFTTVAVKDEDDSGPVLNAKADRVVIHVPLSNVTVPRHLPEGEEAMLRIFTRSGSSYSCGVAVPESLSGRPNSGVGRGC